MFRKVMGFLALPVVPAAMLLSSYAVAGSECLLEGRWQSNKEKTLASMNKTGVISEKQRKIFNGDFFGKLTIEATCDSFVSIYEGNREKVTYETVSQNGNTITFRVVDPLDIKPVTTTQTIVDGCYTVLIPQLKFSEYFCKVE